MALFRTSNAFMQLPEGELGSFAENIVEEMTGNAAFPTPRVPLGDITTATNTFTTDLAASLNGGKAATAKKNASKLALLLLLRDQAAYVQSIAGSNLDMLLSSGFSAASTNRARIVLPQTLIKIVINIQSGKFKIVVKPVPTSIGYELRYKGPTGDYTSAGIHTSSRNIPLENLTPGVTYTVQVRAIGGLTGYGDWSAPASYMAT